MLASTSAVSTASMLPEIVPVANGMRAALDPYDVVLDDYEEGMRTDQVRKIFGVLRPELSALVTEHASDEAEDFMRGPFSIAAQA